MNVQAQVIPRGRAVVQRIGPELSREARGRLAWMAFYERQGRNARFTCRHFGISPDTFYRWRRRYDPRRLESLEDPRGTRRPQRVRQPQTPSAVVERIRALREDYPRWGKDKLAVMLHREGIRLSASTVGRVWGRLKARGVLREARLGRRKSRWRPRPWAQRLPRDYRVAQPGDLVQVDTLDVLVVANLRRKQFTARDMISRYDVMEVYGVATAQTAQAFLTVLRQRRRFRSGRCKSMGGVSFGARSKPPVRR